MKLTEVPAHMVTAGFAAAGTTNATLDDIRRIIAAAFTADENEPTPTGCTCPIHTGEATVDWAALDAVPAELVDAFETGAHEAAHGQKPYSTEDEYIRGGLAAVLSAYESRLREPLAKKIEAVFILADDLSASETRGRFKNCGVFQVVMSDVMKPALRAWLNTRDEVLYVIPVVDDLPSFSVGPKHPERGE